MEQAKERLLKAAEELTALKLRLLRLTNDDPETRDLKVQAAAAINVGEIDYARELVLRAAERHRRAGEELAGALKLHRLLEAEAFAEVAKIEAIRANYLEAARLYEESARLSAPHDGQLSLVYRTDQADVLFQHAKIVPSAESLEQAISILESSVIGVIDQSAEKQFWKRVLSMLSAAQAMLAEMSGGGDYLELLERSISNSELLLSSIDPAVVPVEWCMVANTLGNAILTSGERGGATFDAQMNRAIDIFREVVRLCPREAQQQLWFGANGSLGNGLHSLAIRRADHSSLGLLHEAQTFCELAAELPRETSPADRWVSARVTLALVYCDKSRFDPENRVALLQKAIDTLLEAVDGGARVSAPRLWAHGNDVLGSVYINLSRSVSDLDEARRLIDLAQSAFEEALEVTTLASSPQDWAMTSENACIAGSILSQRTLDPAPVCAAARKMDHVVQVFEGIGSPFHIEKAIKNRDSMRSICRHLGGDCPN